MTRVALSKVMMMATGGCLAGAGGVDVWGAALVGWMCGRPEMALLGLMGGCAVSGCVVALTDGGRGE